MVRLVAAILLSAIGGGTAIYLALFFAGGGKIESLRFSPFLLAFWIYTAVILVVPLVAVYVFVHSKPVWLLALIAGWIPLTALAIWFLRSGDGLRPFSEAITLHAVLAGAVFVVNLLFWMTAGYRKSSDGATTA
jgi:hypothetical protein